MKYVCILFISLSIRCIGQDNAVEIINKLCSPKLHGRGYVNKGDKIAAKYIAKQFRKIGLKKIGHSYFQKFKLDVNTFPKKLFLVLDNDTLLPGDDFLIESNSPGIFGNYKIEEFNVSKIKDKNYIKSFFNPNRIRGKIVKIIQPFTKNRDSIRLYNQLAHDIRELAPVLFFSDNRLIWSVGRSEAKNPILFVKSKFSDANFSEIKVNNKLIKNYISQNVIGFLPSKVKTEKTIIICGHYDHLGRMGRKTYFPGANDNASGIAMMMELAKYVKKNSTNKNIIFIAFGGEEAGLVGSYFFVQKQLIDLKKIDFVFNVDIMGSGDEGITMVNAKEERLAYDKMVKINEDNHNIKVVNKRSQTKNSDHYPFSEFGVPAVFIYTQGKNKNYHDIFDTADHIQMKEFKNILNLFIEFIQKYP